MPSCKPKLIALTAAVVVAAIVATWVDSVRNAALKSLNDERQRVATGNLIPFDRTELKRYAGNDVRFIQNVTSVRDLVLFKGAIFAVTGGGLVKLSTDGKTVGRYTVLDGLPESDLTAAAVYHDVLFIGTRSKGLVAFDGEHFFAYKWADRESQTVTSMAMSGGDLLIGTFAGGLIRFDGADFAEIKPNDKRVMRVTRVVCDGARMYVGTFDNGAWLYESDAWSHVTSSDGLPSDRVVGIAAANDRVYIATDLGLAVHDSSGARSVAEAPLLSDIAFEGEKLLVTKDGGELMSFEKSLSTISDRGGVQNTRLEPVGDRLFQISDSGIAEIVGAATADVLQTRRGTADR